MEDLVNIIPEITLALSSMIFLMIGAFMKSRSLNLILFFTTIVLLSLSSLEFFSSWDIIFVFNNSLIEDGLSRFSKIIIFLSSALSIILATKWLKNFNQDSFEFPILILLSTLGMALMVSANSLISLYLSMELQSLPLYILAAYQRNNVYSSEAGVKYFILGALSSAMFLYGASLIYGFTGSLLYSDIASFSVGIVNIGFTLGLVFIISGIIFKISVVPFHMWTPDVYEGSATPVTAFFAAVPKMAALVALVRLLYQPFGGIPESWMQIIIFVSLSSIALGAIAAIMQTNIKRLIAYSSISHMGYALLVLATGNANQISSLLVYVVIYIITNIGFFSCLINLQSSSDNKIINIDDLSGLSEHHPVMAFGVSMFMFSFAGIPPLAGFFGKYLIFISVIEEGMIFLAVFGLVASVIGAFYYLRIVKIMFFDDSKHVLSHSFSRGLNILGFLCCFFVMAFIVILSFSPLMEIAEQAIFVLN